MTAKQTGPGIAKAETRKRDQIGTAEFHRRGQTRPVSPTGGSTPLSGKRKKRGSKTEIDVAESPDPDESLDSLEDRHGHEDPLVSAH